MKRSKQRLDDLLVIRGLVATKSKAKAMIMAGRVRVSAKVVTKAGTSVADDAEISVDHGKQFVSRGGIKLDDALAFFMQHGLVVSDRVCLDIGASTGGFTDCLLQRGAKRVYAVDVGYGQLAWKLRQDPRVINHERVNFRYVTGDFLPERIALAVADLSFISLEKILPPLLPLLAEGADAVFLIKPQFEVGPQSVGSGGVVRDRKAREAAIARVIAFAESLGFRFIKGRDSTLAGPKGNVEYLAWFQGPQGNAD